MTDDESMPKPRGQTSRVWQVSPFAIGYAFDIGPSPFVILKWLVSLQVFLVLLAQGAAADGFHEQQFVVDGVSRTALIYAPAAAGTNLTPLVFVFTVMAAVRGRRRAVLPWTVIGRRPFPSICRV